MNVFLQRALVVFTLGPLTLLLIYLGGWFYFLAFAALLTIATIEFSQIVGKMGWRTPLWLLIPAVAVQWLLPVELQQQLFGDKALAIDLVSPALLVSLLLAMGYAVWLYERRETENAPAAWFALTAGIILLGWVGSHFFRLRGLGVSAAEWTAVAMIGTWTADSGAYVFGKTLGKHKLSPRVSPNKTVEGYLGGMFAGTMVTIILAAFLSLPLLIALVLGLLVSGVSPLGDLGISLLKRTVGVKDSGNLLPGHGGALDRIDSLIWSMALAFYLLLFTM
jgi:phosphatidate cytidylyltransferase